MNSETENRAMPRRNDFRARRIGKIIGHGRSSQLKKRRSMLALSQHADMKKLLRRRADPEGALSPGPGAGGRS